MTPGTGDLDMRKIGQARNTLMDMRLSQVFNDRLLPPTSVTVELLHYNVEIIMGFFCRFLGVWLGQRTDSGGSQRLFDRSQFHDPHTWRWHQVGMLMMLLFTLLILCRLFSIHQFGFFDCEVTSRRLDFSWNRWGRLTLITPLPGSHQPGWRRWLVKSRWPGTSSWKAQRCARR